MRFDMLTIGAEFTALPTGTSRLVDGVTYVKISPRKARMLDSQTPFAMSERLGVTPKQNARITALMKERGL